MTQPTSTSRFRKEILEFLDETFEQVHGIYLDKGTSLFETLEPVSAAEASCRASDRSGSVAAHVKHVTLNLRVLQRSLRGETVGKVDWREIWENDRPVTTEAWRSVVEDLRSEYAGVVRLLKDPSTWEREDGVGDSMAIAIHTAYHLGAVRQALNVIRRGGRCS